MLMSMIQVKTMNGDKLCVQGGCCGECVLDGLSLPMFKLPGGLNSFGFSNSNLDIKTLLLMF